MNLKTKKRGRYLPVKGCISRQTTVETQLKMGLEEGTEAQQSVL